MAVDLSGTNYSEVDASNSNAAPNGMPEGMAPSGVNDAWRQGMGALKRFWDRINGTATMAGGTTTYTLAFTTGPTAYITGETFRALCNASCTGSSTLNVSSLGAKTIFKPSSAGPVALVSGDLQATEMYAFTYDAALNAAAGGWHVLGVSASAGVTSLADATNGGINVSASTGAITIKQQPSDLLTKASPTTSDSIVIMDAAASNVAKTATIPQIVTGQEPSKATMQTGTDNTQAVTARRVNDADGAAKAWGTFISAGTLQGTSKNISSVTKNGTGDYTVNFTTSFTDANYVVIGVPDNSSTSGVVGVDVFNVAGGGTDPTVSACRIAVRNTSGICDSTRISVAFFGRQ